MSEGVQLIVCRRIPDIDIIDGDVGELYLRLFFESRGPYPKALQRGCRVRDPATKRGVAEWRGPLHSAKRLRSRGPNAPHRSPHALPFAPPHSARRGLLIGDAQHLVDRCVSENRFR